MLIRLHKEAGQRPQLERVDPKTLHYEPGRRRVILFPGEGVSDHSDMATLAGSIKYVEQTLKSAYATKEPIDVLLYTYELPNEDYNGKSAHYAMKRNDLSYYGRQATNFVLLPMLLREKEKLADLTPEMLKERFSSLTLIGHSYGSIAIQDVANTLGYELGRLGWEEAVIADTMKEVVEISVAPIARGDYPAPNFTKFYFSAVNDMTAIDRIRIENTAREQHLPLLRASGYNSMANVIEAHADRVPRAQLLEELKQEVTQKRFPGHMPRASLHSLPSGHVLSAMLPEDEIRWIEKTSEGALVCRYLTTEIAKQNNMTVTHDYRTFLHGEHKLGHMLVNVANNAVMREPGIGNGHQFLMDTDLTKDQLHKRRRQHELMGVSEFAVKQAETRYRG